MFMTRDGLHLGQCRNHTDMSGRGVVGIGFWRIGASPRGERATRTVTGRCRDSAVVAIEWQFDLRFVGQLCSVTEN